MMKSGVRTLYNILFAVGFILSSPYYFVRMRRRGNWQKGFAERWGQNPALVTSFATEESAEAWITGHKRRVAENARPGFMRGRRLR